MAKVLSSISGNLISAASAGYAPTNSADVSAIASAYQVVSATATQLYAGTAFLTEVNGATVSASRAGQAANAGMANSAYYDGTGRLISALPDSAAVSSIASSYAESAASGKADSSSLSSYALSSDVSGVIGTVSTHSASWGAGASLPITGSAYNDTATYEVEFLSFVRNDTAGEPDIRTASLSTDQLYIDYTLDGIDHTSVSLTESMLDFGDSDGDHIVDAYSIDSWNSAVNTVANNSASWGQGGVDSATVSSIASSYAESAASSKLDSTAQVVSSTAGDGTYVTAINGMGISGQGGGGAQVVTATGSATALEGFWPYTTAYLVSSINGSALLPYGYSALSGNSANWNNARTAVTANSANWNSVYNTVSINSASWSGSTGGSVTSPSGTIVVMNGNEIEGTNSAALTASGGEGFETTLSVQDQHIGPQMRILTYGNVPGTGATLMMPLMQAAYSDIPVILSGRDDDYLYASASGNIPLGALTASIPMDGIRSEISASAREWVDLKNAPLTAKKEGGILVTGIGELAWQSAVDNVTNTVSANSATWGQGGVITATGSGKVSTTGISSLNGSSIIAKALSDAGHILIGSSDAGMYLTGGSNGGTAYYKSNEMVINRSGYGEQIKFNLGSAGSQVYGSATGDRGAFIQMSNDNHTAFIGAESGKNAVISLDGYSANSAAMSAWDGVVNTVSVNSASWGQGGVDSATVSAIASAYAESAVSSKQDSSAMSAYALSSDVSGCISAVSANSASWAESGVDSATVSSIASSYAESAASSKMDTSAMTSYALSADVSGTVDLVSTQSANWGGSALALSAGPGISLTMVGNTLVISTAGA